MNEKREALRFFVDRKEFETFEQYLTGAALKKIADIPDDIELYLEVEEGYDPELIENNKEVDLARRGREHFISKPKPFEVIISINGRDKVWKERTISHEQVVEIARKEKPGNGAEQAYLVTYFDGPPQNPKGELAKGVSVYVINNMIFNASPTDKS